MINIPKERDVSEYKDLETLNAWNEMMKDNAGNKDLLQITRDEIQKKSRDNARTPMQWDATVHAGFSSATPWQRENESYTSINVAAQVGIKDSVFEYWVSTLRIRKTYKDLFIYGDFSLVDEENEDIFAYMRTFDDQKALIVTNFRPEIKQWKIPGALELQREKVLISNYDINLSGETLTLRPFEAFACLV